MLMLYRFSHLFQLNILYNYGRMPDLIAIRYSVPCQFYLFVHPGSLDEFLAGFLQFARIDVTFKDPYMVIPGSRVRFQDESIPIGGRIIAVDLVWEFPVTGSIDEVDEAIVF